MGSRIPVSHGVFQDIQEAEHYDRESRWWMRNVVEQFASAAGNWGVTDGKVLDVGSGSGLVTIKFATMLPSVKITGLELSEPVLEMARENTSSSSVTERVTFEKGSADDMPFEDATFDMVVCLSTLHLLENPVKMLDEIHRVLKPDGKFYIRDYRRTWMGTFSGHIKACYTPREVADLLKRSQLQNWRVKGEFFWLHILSID
jgi:ubiquinone/menaquinone biosynthesis C-methylase UbiE